MTFFATNEIVGNLTTDARPVGTTRRSKDDPWRTWYAYKRTRDTNSLRNELRRGIDEIYAYRTETTYCNCGHCNGHNVDVMESFPAIYPPRPIPSDALDRLFAFTYPDLVTRGNYSTY